MKKKDFVIEPIRYREEETNNHICEAFGCYKKSTKKIEIYAGKLGKIPLSICENCLYKFE